MKMQAVDIRTGDMASGTLAKEKKCCLGRLSINQQVEMGQNRFHRGIDSQGIIAFRFRPFEKVPDLIWRDAIQSNIFAGGSIEILCGDITAVPEVLD